MQLHAARSTSSNLFMLSRPTSGLGVSNIDIDIDTIDDTFEVSISISTSFRRYVYVEVSKAVSTILLQLFLSILRYRYFLLTSFTFSTGQSTLACRCDNRHMLREWERARILNVIDHRHEHSV